jgi:hypothetical protein
MFFASVLGKNVMVPVKKDDNSAVALINKTTGAISCVPNMQDIMEHSVIA